MSALALGDDDVAMSVARVMPPFARILVVAAVVVAAYWSSFVGMASMWTLSSFGHGYVIPIVSVVLIWRAQHGTPAIAWTGNWWGVLGVVGCVWLWLVARAAMVQVVEQFAVVAMISFSVWAIAGTAACRQVLFPLAFLLFAVPAGDSVIPTLMRITADLAVASLQAVNIPVLREGMVMTLPNGTFEVADVCSGFRYLNAGLALGVLVAHEMFRGLGRQMVYVLSVMFVFVLTNGVRAFVVMMVASATHMRVFAGRDHVIFGWVLFLVAMLAMYMVAERFSNRNRRGAI